MAEARMRSTCRVQRPSGDQFLGDDGEFHTPMATVYEGPCRLRMVSAVTSDIEAAAQLFVGQSAVLSLPVSTSGDVRVNDLATFLPSGDPGDDLDPALIGQVVRVTGRHYDTDATARRLPVEMVS
jgi:hypothetical protein